jgi:uncharacterized protein (DUF736 family)
MDKSNGKLGALWLKTSKEGMKYMTGTIMVNGVTTKITVFKNKYKTEVKHPEYVIMQAKEYKPKPNLASYEANKYPPSQEELDNEQIGDDVPF